MPHIAAVAMMGSSQTIAIEAPAPLLEISREALTK
jgi:hypothetical protein